MKYLTIQDILLLHNLAIDASGGSHGLRDLGLLESAVMRPQVGFGEQELCPSLFLKVGALMHSLLRNHAFVYGNKRTSLFAAMTMLELNGYVFESGQSEAVAFALKVENNKLSVEEIAEWFEERSKAV